MEQIKYVIKDAVGIHARPAGALVALVKKFNSSILIGKNDKNVDATRLFSIMSLGVKCGDEITIEALGDDEKQAIEEIKSFLENNL